MSKIFHLFFQGESPSLLSLLGAAASTTENWYDGSLTHLGKTEVCLTLSNKFGFDSVVDRANTDRLFVKTKQLLAAVLPCTKESNLIGCLKSATTQEQSDLYWDLVILLSKLKSYTNKLLIDRDRVA